MTTTTTTCTSPSKDGTYSVSGGLTPPACLTVFTVSSGRYSTAFDKIDAPKTYLKDAFTVVDSADTCSSTCGATDKYKGFAFFNKGVENSITTLPDGIDIKNKNCLCLTEKLLTPKSWCLAGDNADGMTVGVSKDMPSATPCSAVAWAPQAPGVITTPSQFVGVKITTDTVEGCKKICETSGICAPSEKGGGTLFGQENCGGWNYSGNSCNCLLQGAFQGAQQPAQPPQPAPAPPAAPESDNCRSKMGEPLFNKLVKDCSGTWNTKPNFTPTPDNPQKICWNDNFQQCGQGQKERLPCSNGYNECFISKVR